MKKISLLLIASLLLSLLAPLAVGAADVEKGYVPQLDIKISAQGIYLKNLDTGDVVYEKNADKPLYPASTTKIMTAILALENTPDIKTEKVTYPMEVQNYLYDYQLTHGAVSSGQLNAGEILTMEEYLYAALLPSANEAAMSIAQHVGQTQTRFAQMMTQRAKELGTTGTNFVNPTGLYDDAHVTTARDLALLTEHALSLDFFSDIVSTDYYSIGETAQHQAHYWDSTVAPQQQDSGIYYPYLSGVKTGTLPESGRCFVSTAEKDGFQYLLVLLGSDLSYNDDGSLSFDNTAFAESIALYDWAFNNFRTKTIVDQGIVVGEIPVSLAFEANSVQVVTDRHFSALMPDSIDLTDPTSGIEQRLDVPGAFQAPIEKGVPVGELVILLKGEEIGRVPVSTASNIKASRFLLFTHWLGRTVKGFWFKFFIVYFILLIASYILLVFVRNKNKHKRRGTPRPPY